MDISCCFLTENSLSLKAPTSALLTTEDCRQDMCGMLAEGVALFSSKLVSVVLFRFHSNSSSWDIMLAIFYFIFGLL